MSSNKLILGAGLAALFLVTKNDNQPPPAPITPYTPVDPTPVVTDDRTVVVSGMVSITAESKPDFATWQRKEWALWYRALAQKSGSERAITIVWASWNSSENHMAYKFPSGYHLERILILWQPDVTVGNIVITENSSPLYDTWTAWLYSSPVWYCPDWMAWFDVMELAWGTQTAQQKFASAWSHPDNWKFLSNGYSCSQDCSFIKIMMERGIDVADTGLHTLCSLSNVPYNLVKAGENITEGIRDTTSLVSKIMPIAILGGGAYFLYKRNL